MIKMKEDVFRWIADVWEPPTFVYSEAPLRENIGRIRNAAHAAGLGDRLEIYAAYFTNSHPALFRMVADEGIGTTLQSLEELAQLDAFGLGAIKKVVSPTALSDNDLSLFLGRGLPVNVSLPQELETALSLSPNVGIRLDLSPDQDRRTGFK